MDDEPIQQQWIIIKPKKRRVRQQSISISRIEPAGGKIQLQNSSLSTIQQEFLASHSFINNKYLFNKLAAQKQQQIQIHCLGLGNFSIHLKPFLQFLFLKQIIVKQLTNRMLKLKLNIFDPVFTPNQIFQIQSMNSTCEQLQYLSSQMLNIVYMPHCERFLHQKICQLKNKNPMIDILVIGNSIKQYKQRCKLLNEAIPQSFLQINADEIKLCDYKEAFNDTYMYLL